MSQTFYIIASWMLGIAGVIGVVLIALLCIMLAVSDFIEEAKRSGEEGMHA